MERFARAWRAQDFETMHAELSPSAATEHPLDELRESYESAQATATVEGIGVQGTDDRDAGAEGSVVSLRVALDTRLFGELEGTIELGASPEGIEWEPHMVLPGLRPGESPGLQPGRVPERAAILARDLTPLAEGPDRSSPIGSAAQSVTGQVGAATGEEADQVEVRGFPAGTPVGLSGLELAFEERLAGKPAAKLTAVDAESPDSTRTIAKTRARAADPLRTTIDPTLQQAAVTALGERLGGVAVLDVGRGQVRALSGVAFSAPQPPGSSFKIVTAAAALQEGITEPKEEFAVVVSADAGGRELENAHDEPCGGTLAVSFARSCNTVFGPLGVELGGERLVDYSESFGFNSQPRLYAEQPTTIIDPPASTIPDPIESPVEVGVTAIGQGKLLATPLQMASVARVIAGRGELTPTPIVTEPGLAPADERRQVISAQTAKQVRKMMVDVVREGTGTSAALSSTQVAGKTGTAELGPKEGAPPPPPGEDPELEVDAWFVGFAPAGDPKLAIAVMIINAEGDGGVVAAPIARSVLAARFGR